MKIQLPNLERKSKKKGTKNYISQLVFKGGGFDFTIIDSGSTYLVIKCEGMEIYLSKNPKNAPLNYRFCLKTSSKPTSQRIVNNDIKLKWFKHPLDIEYSIEDIRNSWKGSFNFKEEDSKEGVYGLREPQIAAIYSILSHLKVGREVGTVVMPTGTGKTETMLSILVAARCSKLLITVPSDALRNQLFKKFKGFGLLKQFGIVGNDAILPKVGVLKSKFKDVNTLESFFNECNVVISTMAIVADSSQEQIEKIASVCSHLFIDEAHHVKARSWDLFKNEFDPIKVLQFTATPFRNDQKRLDGRIIFNFPLKKAQEQGYFKRIELLTFREYDLVKADETLAEIAVSRLREDIRSGKNHILMARCKNKNRARLVFEHYEKYEDLNPVLIYSNIPDKAGILQRIIAQEHKIIVAVDMLGEGFDLPQLKIAAFHDIRKSLPVTLQFAGRFTRTSIDDNLGNASFIVNLADANVTKELDDLYAQDSDWNLLLDSLSTEQVDEQVDFEEFVSGFEGLSTESIPFQNIRPALSTVIYKNHTNEWFPINFELGLRNIGTMEYIFHDINRAEKMMVIVYAQKTDVDWGNVRDMFQINWNVIIVYWETQNNLLFIHSSDKSSLYKELAKSIIGDDAELVNQIDIFRVFHGVNRVSLQNVGLKEFLGKRIKFRMNVGTDIEEALSTAETSRGQKAFVFGSGFENGDKITLGCSYKGRVWSYQTGNLKMFQKWCKKIGSKVVDETIDPNEILRHTLIPTICHSRPTESIPVWIDWDEEMYKYKETRYRISINHHDYNLSNCELNIVNPTLNENIQFELNTENDSIRFEIRLTPEVMEDGITIPKFEIVNLSDVKVTFSFGTKNMSAEMFLEQFEPKVWFADGSSLTGTYHVKLKQDISSFKPEELISWNWDGVDIRKEAQGVLPKIQDSIQFNVIERLLQLDYDIIYDDDYSGEIADIITIKDENNKLRIELYHLKYAIEGRVSGQVSNFYEVCGQAQKSINWKHKSGREFFDHLLRRVVKSRNTVTCSRLEKGTNQQLERLLEMAKRDIPMVFEVFIVQPSLSKAQAANYPSIMTLLGVTENYLKETAAIDLKVIVNE